MSSFRRPRRVLIRPRHRRVHRHIPGDQTSRVRPSLKRGQNRRPRAVALPVPEQPVHRAPVSIPGRRVPPRCPVRVRHRIPAISWRRVHVAGRPGFFLSASDGASGSSTAHCAFVRPPSQRDHPGRITADDRHQPRTRTSQTDPGRGRALHMIKALTCDIMRVRPSGDGCVRAQSLATCRGSPGDLAGRSVGGKPTRRPLTSIMRSITMDRTNDRRRVTGDCL